MELNRPRRATKSERLVAAFVARELDGTGWHVVRVVVPFERLEPLRQHTEDGIVLAQAPSGGTNLSPGDRVTLTVGDFTAPDTTTDTTSGGTGTTGPGTP